MKLIKILSVPLCLGACSTGGGPNITGISPYDGTALVGLGNEPAKEAAHCMSLILKTAVQVDNDGYALTVESNGYKFGYRIHPIVDKYNRYITQVDQIGSPPPGLPSFIHCLDGNPATPPL